MDDSALAFATLPELRGMLQKGDLKPSELANFFRKRLETYGPQLNAVACITDKRAKHDTNNKDFDYQMSRARGALHAIPYGVKDLLAVEGYPTTWGAKPYADQTFSEDAHVVDKLDGAGAVLLAKLAMVELAGGGGYHSAGASLQGPGRNPWNPAYWSGGSSSGSGAAVAAGLVPFALGSETSGSILTPAAYCGVTGLRPSFGLVSRTGAMPLSWTLDKVGVFAHNGDDCGLVLSIIAGGDDRDGGSAGKSFYFTPNWYKKVSDFRVGYAEVDWHDWPDEAARPAFGEALAAVKAIGSQMVKMRLPDFPYGPVISAIIGSESASIFEMLIRSADVDRLEDPGQAAGLRAALDYTAVDYLKAMRVRSEMQGAFRRLFADIDILVAPSRFDLPDKADGPFDESEKKTPEVRGIGAGLIPAGNLCGLPAVSLPCGFVNGLPIGLQIVGPPFTENRLFAWARAFQQGTSWHKQHPKMTLPT